MKITHHTYPEYTSEEEWQFLACQAAELVKRINKRLAEEATQKEAEAALKTGNETINISD